MTMRADRHLGRRVADRAATALASAAVVLMLLPLGAILADMAYRGLGGLSLALFREVPRPSGEAGGGIANAIVGTLELVALASAMAIPVGVLAGLYLAEYRATRFAGAVRFCADVLASVPSILVGVFVYAAFVVPTGHFSGLAGAIALAVMMLPLVTRTTDELARTVPDGLREAAIALGAPRSKIAVHVVLRTALPGIRAGTMLAVARVCGETAPLLFTTFDSDHWAGGPLDPTSTMQVRIFSYALSSNDDRHAQAWAASLVLVTIVVILDLVARRTVRAARGRS